MSESITPVSAAYTATVWEKGDIISAFRLNKLENAAATSSAYLEGLGPSASSGPITGTGSNGSLNSVTTESDKAGYLFTAGALAASSNVANGWVRLDSKGLIPSSHLPSYVDDILEGYYYNGKFYKTRSGEEGNYTYSDQYYGGYTDSNGSLDTTKNGEIGKIYVDLSNGRSYRWSGTQFVETGVIHLDYADTPNSGDANNPISDWNKYYVKSVTQDDGKITVIHNTFSPSLTLTEGTASTAPKIKITVGGNISDDITLTTATTEIYGATKLNNNTVISGSLSNDATLAVTALGVKNAIESLDVSDTAVSTDYISAISETDGKISVTRATFSPSLSLTNGTSSNAPKINISVAGNSMPSPIELTKASEGSSGVYGVTKLSNAIDGTDENIAATPKAVSSALASANSYTDSAIDALDVSNITGFGTDKTLSALTETNGIISASFQTISITHDKVTDLGTAALATIETTAITTGSSSTNLPTSAQVAAFVEGKGYLTSQTKANWDETNNNSAAYIQNKPNLTNCLAIPTLPTTAGVYKLQVTIENETPIYAWIEET